MKDDEVLVLGPIEPVFDSYLTVVRVLSLYTIFLCCNIDASIRIQD